MFCPSCGSQARPEARFCDACGQPLSVAAPGTGSKGASLRTEYRTVVLDWQANPIRTNQGKKPPHPQSQVQSEAEVNRRVLSAIQPLLDQGWTLEGPLARSVYLTESWSSDLFFSNTSKITGARITLRRQTST
jgi:hypothetical protein